LDPEDGGRRALRRWIVASGVVHALAFALVVWGPDARRAPSPPGVVSVDLVALAAPARAVRPAPAPPKATRAAEAPEAISPPRPQQPKPEPPRREAVLPKTPERAPEPKKPRRPEPDPKPAPRPKPQAKPAPPPPPARKQESYEDVLAGLRAERGESRPEPAAAATPAAAPAAPDAAGGSGAPTSPEVAVWLRAAKYHVEQAWVLPPGFQRESLEAVVRVSLDAQGTVRAQPRVVRRSGDPWYDESVVRAIEKASPLPPPPEAGEWEFAFQPPKGPA
jgi:TonB family protein